MASEGFEHQAANMLFDVDDTLAMCDFQWAGKAAPSKDLAYCLVSSAASLTLVEEDTYLRFCSGDVLPLRALPQARQPRCCSRAHFRGLT
mmetsp:Transcript_72778/g.236380  ORF Transcript_72778/g.236380 Transcript_72778/m.236380 type:complete len:90 (-) Transcript_72778:208-477(-)